MSTERELFQVEFDKLGYRWSESNQAKAFLGWELARAAMAELAATEISDEQVETALKAAFLHSTNESRKDMRRALESVFSAATPHKVEKPALPEPYTQVVKALAGLLEQVESFVSKHGEADFETAEALQAVEAAVRLEAAQAVPEPVALPELEWVPLPTFTTEKGLGKAVWVYAEAPPGGEARRAWEGWVKEAHKALIAYGDARVAADRAQRGGA